MPLTNPTAEQSAAISAIQSYKSVLVDSVAGSGKTSTIESAAQKFGPETLMLAFNKSVKQTLDKRVPSLVLTLNGLGHRAWAKQLNQKIEVSTDKAFKLTQQAVKDEPLTREDFIDIMNLVSVAERQGYLPRPFGAAPSAQVAPYKTLCENEDISHHLIPFAKRVHEESVKLALRGIINFNEQVYLPIVFGAPFPQFDRVLVDEAQDLSPLNHEQIRRLRASQIVAVGDPFQAIYGFRGADYNSISTMTSDFSLSKYPLTVSFRCSQRVIERAQEIVPHIQHRPDAPSGLVTRIESIQSIPRDSTVLCRFNAPLFKIYFQLWSINMPAYFAGTKDLMGTFKRIVNKISNKMPYMPIPAFLSKLQEWEEEKPKKRGDQAECLRTMISNISPSNTTDFLAKLTALLEKRGSIRLSTIHKAKGGEWNDVVWLNPYYHHSSEGPQESNLDYVAITRAINNLYLLTV